MRAASSIRWPRGAAVSCSKGAKYTDGPRLPAAAPSVTVARVPPPHEPRTVTIAGLRPPLTAAVVGNVLDVASDEFLFRGFLMWTLIRVAGPIGVVLATFPFVFTHLGKPELETLSTFVGGLGFGWIAWRTRSILYGALLHA